MKFDRRFLLVFIALILISLACQAVTSGTQATGEQSTEPTRTASPQILFQDDFSNTSSGWDDIEDEEGFTGYRDGSYRIYINKTDWYFWSTPGLNFSDVIIDVDTTKQGGPDKNEFGVICRYIDVDNFYILAISSDGYYGISKFVNGEHSSVGVDQMEFNDKVIKLGASSNHIRASCVENRLTLEVNGQILADFKDDDLTAGDVGVIASTYEEPGTDIAFDNFTVTRP
jgi:hypothetical protein